MIDPKSLPKAAMVDTCVLTRVEGDRPSSDKRAESCKEFFEEMLRSGRRIYIAAPTLAEYIRGDDNKAVPPRYKDITVVSFDDRAARALGRSFPESTLLQFRDADGTCLDYVKYDAIIVACAIANKIPCIVSLDGHPKTDKEAATKLFRLAEHVGLQAYRPEGFQHAQLSLNLNVVTPKHPSGSDLESVRIEFLRVLSSKEKHDSTTQAQGGSEVAPNGAREVRPDDAKGTSGEAGAEQPVANKPKDEKPVEVSDR